MNTVAYCQTQGCEITVKSGGCQCQVTANGCLQPIFQPFLWSSAVWDHIPQGSLPKCVSLVENCESHSLGNFWCCHFLVCVLNKFLFNALLIKSHIAASNSSWAQQANVKQPDRFVVLWIPKGQQRWKNIKLVYQFSLDLTPFRFCIGDNLDS